MTDTTTQRIDTGGRSPEFHHAVGLLQGLREDLLQGALAYRPLAPMAVDGPVTRRLPARIRQYAVWVPHALVVGAALVVFAAGYSITNFYPAALLSAGAVLLTLVRPVAAFWASLLTAFLYAVLAGAGELWSPVVFLAHLVVMTVVAARTRPRAAAWMWVMTALYAMLTGTLLGGGGYGGGGGTAELLFAAALALLVVTVWQVRRTAREEVTAQLTVTAQERSMRTLLEERTTIARELHDVVAHHMSVVAIQAEAAPYRVENPPPELEQAFVTIRENAVAALTELRRVLGVVRAEDYEAPDAPQPTLADLEGLLANVREAGLDVELTVTGAVRELPQGVELSAYRIVQEALSNVLRHAPGAAARVEVAHVLGGLGLRVVNGPPRGLVKPSPGAGHGITGMRERVAMLSGELTADATDDGGYEVAAFIPVPRDEAAA
ncbi:sensor histidine kinase [Streptomyces thermolilacinus]|uniref:histidine kinase n=1 Tax=Streptomyces thermolilacinus SPC6 TaxID=1306406 RepID=A0A1D3DTI5_9ACTN|nr:histidine kinase [Streptomyces thermolilacinus]OEJ95609.1 two-component sensor histidine kinase [Streptomyces thermolilacinus SPC6]